MCLIRNKETIFPWTQKRRKLQKRLPAFFVHVLARSYKNNKTTPDSVGVKITVILQMETSGR